MRRNSDFLCDLCHALIRKWPRLQAIMHVLHASHGRVFRVLSVLRDAPLSLARQICSNTTHTSRSLAFGTRDRLSMFDESENHVCGGQSIHFATSRTLIADR
jgi:hypothetical protein